MSVDRAPFILDFFALSLLVTDDGTIWGKFVVNLEEKLGTEAQSHVPYKKSEFGFGLLTLDFGLFTFTNTRPPGNLIPNYFATLLLVTHVARKIPLRIYLLIRLT